MLLKYSDKSFKHNTPPSICLKNTDVINCFFFFFFFEIEVKYLIKLNMVELIQSNYNKNPQERH